VRENADAATLVIDGKPFRRLEPNCWDPQRRIADMREQDVRAQVLSPMPELLSFWLEPAETAYLATHVNEHIAAMVATAPERFAGLGMVAAQDLPTALAQLDEIARLDLAGIEIGTHINGVPLGDAALWPLYEAAEARDLAIFVHPLHPAALERIGGVPEVCLAASFPLEIAMAAVSLISAGIPLRFPALRILLSHGGGALPTMFGRLALAREVIPQVRSAFGEDPRATAQRFWFDSNVYDPATLRFLASQIGFERIVIGSDYPFAIKQERPSEFVEGAIPGAVHQCARNAAAFLYGSRVSRWRFG